MADIERLIQIGIDSRAAKVGGKIVEGAFKGVTNAGKVALTQVGRFRAGLVSLSATMKTVRGTALGLTGAIGAGFLGRSILDEMVGFETALVSVGKTTDIVGDDLARFGKIIDQLSRQMPISTGHMLTMARVAGQLGIRGEKDLTQFTKTLAQLEKATNIIGEEGALKLARLLEITGEPTSNIAVLGAAITKLGNDFAASEKEIVRVSTEVASSLAEFGLQSIEIASISTALATLGKRAELSGSAVGRSFRKISTVVSEGGEGLKVLADLTGKSSEAFAKGFGEDPLEHFIQFLEGLGEFSKQGGKAATVLAQIGLKGEEINKTITPLALRIDIVREALEKAFGQKEIIKLGGIDELTRESMAAFATLGSAIERFKNNLASAKRSLTTDNSAFTKFVDTLANAVGLIFGLSSSLKDATTESKALAIVIKGLGTGLLVIIGISLSAWFLTSAASAVKLLVVVSSLLVKLTLLIAIITAPVTTFFLGDFVFNRFKIIQTTMARIVNITQRIILVFKTLSLVIVALFKGVALEALDFFTERLADALDKIGSLAVSIGNAFRFVPGIDTLVSQLTGLGKVATGLRGAFDDPAVFGGIDEVVKSGAKELGILKQELAAVLLTIDRDFAAGAAAGRSGDINPAIVDNIAQRVLDLTKQLNLSNKDLAKVINDTAESYLNLAGAAENFTGDGTDGPIEHKITIITELQTRIAKLIEEAKNGSAAFKELDKEIGGFFTRLAFERKFVNETTEARERAADATKLQTLLIERYGEGSVEAAKKLAQFESEAKGLADLQELKQFADDIGDSFGTMFSNMILDAQSAKDAILDLTRAIAELVVQQAVARPISNAISSIFTTPNAKGNAFGAGGITPFASGGIVSSPTLFGFNGGTGLMGEAGPEAILPLSRGKGGELGVKAQGGVVNNISIINSGGGEVGVAQQKNSTGGADIMIMVDRVVASSIRDRGHTGQALEQVYGAKRLGISRG